MRAGLKLVESDPDDLIPLAVAAKRIGLGTSTIRQRKAGTENLTLIRQGRNLFLIQREVIAYRQKLIEDAQRRTDPIRLVTR